MLRNGYIIIHKLTTVWSLLTGIQPQVRIKSGTHDPHVTWAHIKLTFYFQLLPYPFPCVGSHMLISIIWWLGVIQKGPLVHFFNKHFLHFWKKNCNVWRALDTYVTSHEMCATAEIWEACWHVSRPELHTRSRDVSRVTEVWICAIEFNVKSPPTSQLHALTSHELTWREDSVSPA